MAWNRRTDPLTSHPTIALRSALGETLIEGINTNIALHRDLMVDARFIEGGTNIHYLEQWLAQRFR